MWLSTESLLHTYKRALIHRAPSPSHTPEDTQLIPSIFPNTTRVVLHISMAVPIRLPQIMMRPRPLMTIAVSIHLPPKALPSPQTQDMSHQRKQHPRWCQEARLTLLQLPPH